MGLLDPKTRLRSRSWSLRFKWGRFKGNIRETSKNTSDRLKRDMIIIIKQKLAVWSAGLDPIDLLSGSIEVIAPS